MEYSEIDMQSFYQHQGETIEYSEFIVRANIFFENLCNFEQFDEEKDKQLLDNIFKLSYLLEGYSHCGCYDFDHISYALLGWSSEHEEEEVAEFISVLLNDCIEDNIDDLQLTTVWKMVEMYNDIEADFFNGRVLNGK